jgi:hypothetical protein
MLNQFAVMALLWSQRASWATLAVRLKPVLRSLSMLRRIGAWRVPN